MSQTTYYENNDVGRTDDNHAPKFPVSTLWIGPDLTAYEQLSLSSFVRAGHPVNLYVYSNIGGVPSGVEVKAAKHILPETIASEFIKKLHLAMFADLFRYELMASTGETWVDADLVKLCAPLPNAKYLFAYESKDVIANGLVRAPHDSRILEFLLGGARQMLSPHLQDVPWGTYGPKLLTSAVTRLGLESFALSARQIYPIHFAQVSKLFSTRPQNREWCESATQDSMTLHLWNKFLLESRQKHLSPNPESYLGGLMLGMNIPLRPPYVSAQHMRIGLSRFSRLRRRFVG